jgi:hypothetical protein
LLECTKRLLEREQPSIDVNLQDIYGDTALHDIGMFLSLTTTTKIETRICSV